MLFLFSIHFNFFYLCSPFKKLDTKELLNRFAAQPSCRQIHSQILANDGRIISIRGLTGSTRSLAISANFNNQPTTQIFVANDRETAEYMCNDLTLWCNPEQVFLLPSSFKRNIQYGQSDASNMVQRTTALNALRSNTPCIVVTYSEALAELVTSREEMERNALRLHKGEMISMDFLRETLVTYNFERVDFVTEPGQYALRGSIVDIFSFANNRPFRIDFFGDEVESIRAFNVDTQLSDELLQEVEIISNLQEIATNAKQLSLFEFTEQKAIWWIEDWNYLVGTIELLWKNTELRNQLLSPEMLQIIPQKHCTILMDGAQQTSLNETLSGFQNIVINFSTTPQPTFNKNFELLSADILEHAEQGYTTYIFSENTTQIERLKAIFSSIGKENTPFEFIQATPHEGFIDHELRICCYPDHQLFERYHRVTVRRAVEKSERLTWQELSGMQQGDYIVHIDHGVGVFGGLVKTNVNGKIQEVIKLVYRDNDVLFVNIHGLHRISRYKSKDSEPPKINKLGSPVWQNLKQSAKRKVKDIARELIALYAKRKHLSGFAFATDTYLQHELEASFIYEDTPDQMKATQAVKADMEQAFPMDRLICGDVGFGKTEIAVRAAFKAATDGKQVAILVPTTILALQHFKTFSARLSNFPVKVDYVSRLRPPTQIKETLKNVSEGKIDIVIGTHRLLNKEIKFKDLGLLVIDEEQKFGVAAKEKLRQLKYHVDTLTMTATPIPRTLQFSLMGARDLSIINTPPPNRHPIVTEVYQFNENIIRDAIRYEIQRGGQVFFVHNRVQDIQAMADIIQRACPEATLCIGHGQMPAEQLEKVILGFMNNDYDILLCTTIVENGLDIPNANTIIINQAQNFGLSDLHQLRGRVGRSNRKAFCYLLAPPPVALTDDARRRLKAIETFSDLGSGFNIAMQDLDIRGAGNLLGGEQSGFIADIGFETYQRILNEALTELHNEQPTSDNTQKPSENGAINWISDCSIDTDMEILIPDSYVNNVTEKLRLYKELDNITEETQLQKMIHELTDRFGALPPEVEQLCNIVRLRRIAIQLGFEKIILKNKLMIVYFVSNQLSNYYRSPLFSHILQYIQNHQKIFSVKEQNNKLMFTVKNIATVQHSIDLMLKMKSADV